MTHIQDIAQSGNPVLAARAQEVEDPTSPQIQELIDQMLATVDRAGGMGIAAPQVSTSKRIFIMCSKPNDRYPHAPEMEPEAIINPELVSCSEEMETDWEGCLSVPNTRGLVARHTHIRVRYLRRDGSRVERSFSHFPARIFQHEWDHLEGVLFPERAEKLMPEDQWRDMMRSAAP